MTIEDPTRIVATLRGVPILQRLDKRTLLELARRAREVSYAAGSTLATEGDPGDALCILLAGSADVVRAGRVVADVTTGSFFGEMSLIDGRPRSASIIAREDVTLLVVDARDFDSLLNIPYVARAVLEALSLKLREAHESHSD